MDIIVNIPFPYTQFTDTKFILTDKSNGLFIPDDCYTRINDHQIQFKSNNKVGITQNSEIKFTFFHTKNKRWIGKVEYHMPIEFTGQKQFNLPTSPYNQIVNLHKRVYVFYNRRRQSKGTQYYINDDQGQIVLVNKRLKSLIGDRVDVLIIYSYGNQNGAIQELPQSGYIALSKYEIDRNYNTNLMAVFVNGKLVKKDHILQMTNTLYKIDKDIKSRYNIEVKNLSPKINSMIPYYKQHYTTLEEDIDKKDLSQNIICSIDVKEYPKGRRKFPFYFSPIYFFPDLINDMRYDDLVKNYKDHAITKDQDNINGIDWEYDSINIIREKLRSQGIGLGIITNPDLWINLILRKSNVNYELKLYSDDIIETPSNINVLMQLRTRTYRDFERYNNDAIIIAVLPAVITNTDKDEIIASIQIKTIMELDYMKDYATNDDISDFITYLTTHNLLNKISIENKIDVKNDSVQVIQKKIKRIKKELNLKFSYTGTVDGVIGRFQSTKNEPIHYTLQSDGLDETNTVNVFRWTISTEKNNNGIILWDKDLSLTPDNIFNLV